MIKFTLDTAVAMVNARAKKAGKWANIGEMGKYAKMTPEQRRAAYKNMQKDK